MESLIIKSEAVFAISTKYQSQLNYLPGSSNKSDSFKVYTALFSKLVYNLLKESWLSQSYNSGTKKRRKKESDRHLRPYKTGRTERKLPEIYS
jgi:hypothetical protein